MHENAAVLRYAVITPPIVCAEHRLGGVCFMNKLEPRDFMRKHPTQANCARTGFGLQHFYRVAIPPVYKGNTDALQVYRNV